LSILVGERGEGKSPMRSRYAHLLLTGLVFLALALSACGGTESSAKSEVTINVYDNYFDPKNIDVKANDAVKVTFINKGTNVHIVEIKGLIAETTMQPGETKSFTITPQKRSYKLYDELYVSKGMEGVFQGTETAQANAATTPTVSADDPAIKAAVDDYRTYVEQQVDKLKTDSQTFVDAINAHDLTKAQQLYAPARMAYERVEPIAESFGDLDPLLDARENDVPLNEWGGFHRIEKVLWIDKTTKGLENYTKDLVDNVAKLRQQVETVELVPVDIIDGAVALLDEASHSKITGEEERYSHTDLYDLAANVQGSRAAFDVFGPYLQKKNAALYNDITDKFAKLDTAVKPFQSGSGYVDYAKLTDQNKRDITQAINAVGEQLAKVAVDLPQKK
jgi:iron uptake system component EfeO